MPARWPAASRPEPTTTSPNRSPRVSCGRASTRTCDARAGRPMADLGTRIADADTLVHLVPPTVRENDRLSEIVRSAASDPIARSAFVVDGTGRLVGVTAVAELDRDLLTLITPGGGGERLSGRQLA